MRLKHEPSSESSTGWLESIGLPCGAATGSYSCVREKSERENEGERDRDRDRQTDRQTEIERRCVQIAAPKVHRLLYHSTLGLRVIKKSQTVLDSALTFRPLW